MNEEQAQANKLFALLERGVSAIEKLGEEPVIHMEAAPPVCPHCGFINPEIRVLESEARGPMATYLIAPTCERCGNKFYAVPIAWHVFQTVEEARIEIEQRGEVLNSG